MKWPEVALGDVIRHRSHFFTIDDLTEYKRCRVQLHAKGIVLRDLVPGAMVKTKKQQTCRAGELLVAEIDAKVGGYGIVPSDLDGAIVSSHYFLYEVDDTRLDRQWLGYFIQTPAFAEQVGAQGSTNYAAIRPKHVLDYKIPLPPLAEQLRLVETIEARMGYARSIKCEWSDVDGQLDAMALGVYREICGGAQLRTMAEVAPLVRRPVQPLSRDTFPELGVRSFGRGTFHKPDLPALEVGTKKLFEIWEGDLLFNIVFAWEGAVAVAKAEDHGRVGSHRFLTCVANPEIAIPEFLEFHLLTAAGIADLGQASPGGAGRNRTLGVEKLANLNVPIPPLADQRRLVRLLEQSNEIKRLRAESAKELDALLPSILHRAFRGEL